MYLEDRYINQDARGIGAEKKIMKYLAQQALEHNCGRFEWVVLDWNKSAINFIKVLAQKRRVNGLSTA